jgi:uncharacterized lipoprotein YehR (DUF1307 family)
MADKVKRGESIMLLKRLAAIVVALILVVQLTACSQNTPKDNASNTNISSIETSKNDNLSSGIQQDKPQQNDSSDTQSNNSSVESNMDNSSEKIPTGDIASSENQDADVPQQNDKNETDKDNIVTGCNHGDEDPYLDMSKSEFYAEYKTACCNTDATYRSKHGFLSGSLEVPGQYAVESQNRPKSNGKFVRNTSAVY